MQNTRHRPRKRQRAESPDFYDDKTSDGPKNQDELKLSTTFDKFENILWELHIAASVVGDVAAVLGEQRAKFVVSLNKMLEGGEMPWAVCEIRGAGSGGEMEVDEAGEGEIIDLSHVEGPSSASGGKEIVEECVSVSREWPPPLPSVKNAALRLQALTPDTKKNTSNPLAHYQRLEWLGDAYMEAVVSRILFERFPEAREGQLTKIRQPLLTNRLFSSYAATYKFDTMITGFKALSNPPGGQTKVQYHWKLLADCFEAYVAAVALSDLDNGFEILVRWLAALYEPIFRCASDGEQIDGVYLLARGVAINPGLFLAQASELERLMGSTCPKRAKGSRLRPRKTKAQKRAERKQTANIRNNVLPVSRRLIQYETGQVIIIEDSGDEAEDEGDWEEIEIVDKGCQSSAEVLIDTDVKRKLRMLLAGDGVFIDYVYGDGSSSSGGDAMQDGLMATIMLNGWGYINQPIGSGWGANEESVPPSCYWGSSTHYNTINREASLKAAMNVMGDKAFCKELALRKYKSGPVSASQKQENSATGTTPSVPSPWKEIDGVVIIHDD